MDIEHIIYNIFNLKYCLVFTLFLLCIHLELVNNHDTIYDTAN